MDVDEYKKRREARLAAAGGQERERCWTCRRPAVRCLCDQIEPFSTQAHFVILIHPREAHKEKLGTGRLASLCLRDADLIRGVDFTDHPQVNGFLEDPAFFPMLLYPGDDAYNISERAIDELPLPAEKRLLLFVVDGTWPCAKKMVRLSKNLQRLPRLCFTPKQGSEFVIKQQPHEFCLSTIESIHYLLEEMERVGFDDLAGAHHNLRDVFQALVGFQLKCIADPDLPGYRRKTEYKPMARRKRSTKWDKRSIIYKGSSNGPK